MNLLRLGLCLQEKWVSAGVAVDDRALGTEQWRAGHVLAFRASEAWPFRSSEGTLLETDTLGQAT